MDIKQKIQQAVAATLPELNLKPGEIHIDHPDISMGDYSTNVALAKAKELKMNPRELALKLVSNLAIDGIERIEVAGPGFINFYLSKTYLDERVREVNRVGRDFGRGSSLSGAKMMFEYTDPNPFKQFHIGHLMSNAIGESLSRLAEFAGAEVKRANYQGDVGLHVAKAIWGMLRTKGAMPDDSASLNEKTAFIGSAYVEGSNAYEDDEAAKAEINELNKKIFLKSDPDLNELYAWGRRVSLDHFEEIYAKLGTKFDFYFFENEVADRGIALVNQWLSKGVFEKSDGAVVFKGEAYDPSLHTRVFLNSQGLPTYEAKELGLAERKHDAYGFDRSVTITASEQNDYFRVVMKALEQIDKPLRDKITHVSHGMLRFESGKMSSRKGNVVTGESLIAAVENLVLEKMKEREMRDDEKRKAATEVGVAAIKYSILKQAPGRDIIYDFDTSLSFEGDSGPYLQYAAVRASSVLEKAKAEDIADDWSVSDDEIPELVRVMHRFPEVAERAWEEMAPNHIATYLIELSGAYNSYYAKHKIVDGSDPHSPYRVALTKSFVQTVANGLYLLGIRVPERM